MVAVQGFSDVPDVWDVIVVGGGTAGIGAAYSATMAGAKTLLLESGPCLGGAITTRNIASFCGLFTCSENPRPVVKGVWSKLYQYLSDAGATGEIPHKHRGVFQVVDPELAKYAFDDFAVSEGLCVLYHVQVIAATRVPNNYNYNPKSNSSPSPSTSTSSSSPSLWNNNYTNGNSNSNSNGNGNINGNGITNSNENSQSNDLGYVTSVTIHERRGQRVLYAKAFVDASGDADLAAYAGASTRYGNQGLVNLGSLGTRFGGLSPGTKPNSVLWSKAIKAAKAADPNLGNIIKKDKSVLLTLPGSGDIITYLASAIYDARDSLSMTRAEIQGRRQAQEYLKILRTLPGHENLQLMSSGPFFGTRESRRINCLYQITEQDVLNSAKFHDTIALGSWGMEHHDQNDPDWASTFVLPGGPDGVFDIPLRSLCSIDTPNLFAAGRTIDGDRMGGASVRVMGTALATGQAAGVAASIVALTGVSPPPYKQVRDILIQQGAILDCQNIGAPVSVITT